MCYMHRFDPNPGAGDAEDDMFDGSLVRLVNAWIETFAFRWSEKKTQVGIGSIPMQLSTLWMSLGTKADWNRKSVCRVLDKDLVGEQLRFKWMGLVEALLKKQGN